MIEKQALILVLTHPKRNSRRRKKDENIEKKILEFMCANFFDIRTFSAVMTTFVSSALNCGQIRGPVQMCFAKSIDPIVPQEITITRMAIAKERDAGNRATEMGRKYIIPYGLYRCEGFISANLAQKVTGFSEEDLQLFWQAILNMFENDRSANKGKMSVRKLIVFKHDSIYGNAPSYKLFERVSAEKKDVIVPRSYNDYIITVNTENLPHGVSCSILE